MDLPVKPTALWAPRQWLGSIEALRGIAALAVVLFHATLIYGLAEFTPWTVGAVFQWLGQWGVILFFVLSGFCIHLPAARQLAQGAVFRLDKRVFFSPPCAPPPSHPLCRAADFGLRGPLDDHPFYRPPDVDGAPRARLFPPCLLAHPVFQHQLGVLDNRHRGRFLLLLSGLPKTQRGPRKMGCTGAPVFFRAGRLWSGVGA